MPTRLEKDMWWDRAWKLMEGFTKVSPGCLHCWSESESHMRSHQKNPKISGRFGGVLTPGGKWNGQIKLREDNLELPLHTKKPTRFAVWNDLFHDQVSIKFLCRVFDVIESCPQHTFLILTKRPENMRWMLSVEGPNPINTPLHFKDGIPLKNVWLGVTAENQEQADKRIPILLQIPAAVRFVSVEPMLSELSEINLRKYSMQPNLYSAGDMAKKYAETQINRNYLDWVICGGESGRKARPMHIDWVRKLRDDCVSAGVPIFIKQLHINGKLSKNMAEWPEEFKIRQLPGVDK
jgi:protein gp37